MPASIVQQVMQRWFEQWGRPAQMQLDHGQPWQSGRSDLPSLFELWLIGLGIEVVWSRPCRPQDNGIVERSHRTTQAWSAPAYCRDLEHLQYSLDEAARVQRQLYPTETGTTRLQRYPQLLACPRPYQINKEPQLWSLQRVYSFLAQGCWQRKVDASGRISLYNHNYTVGRALGGQMLWVRFEPTTGEWLYCNEKGVIVGRSQSLEINSTVIRQLRWHRSKAQWRKSLIKPDVAPPI
ncbi:MAG: hypothetical protein AAFV72_10170 [Cyanobacteria bacterium J06635_1]